MKVFFLSISILLINISTTAQSKSNYARGFEVGFKEGYCYNHKDIDCFYPMTPLAPLPRINESENNYTQGYNRGFQFGLDLKRSNDALDNANYNLNMEIIKYNDYVRQIPIEAMVAVGMIKQQKYDLRKDWIQTRIDELIEIRNILFSRETLPRGYDINNTRSKYWKKTIDYANSIRSVDFADDHQFRLIQSNFNNIEKYLYNSFNQLMAQSTNDKNLDSGNKTIKRQANGKVCFWSNLYSGGDHKVYINGKFVGNISKHFKYQPSCGEEGTLTIILSPGKYSVYSKGQRPFFGYKKWNETITVKEGNCTMHGFLK